MSDGVGQPTLEPAVTYVPGVDVIVVNYQTPLDLRRFLDSYDHRDRDDARLSVVNVCPRDDDRRVVGQYVASQREFPASRLTVLESDNNIGYNRAVNRAGTDGEREFIAVFNADVVLRPGALDELVAALREHPGWGVVGPRQVDDRGLLTATGIVGTPAAPQWRCWKQPGGTGLYSDVREDCVTVLGSAFVMRRSVWDQLAACELYRAVAPNALGPMLPTFGYWGETYMCTHAAVHGWKLGYLGTTTIVHRWHGASGGVVGGNLERNRDVDQAYFRRACDQHGIPHD